MRPDEAFEERRARADEARATEGTDERDVDDGGQLGPDLYRLIEHASDYILASDA